MRLDPKRKTCNADQKTATDEDDKLPPLPQPQSSPKEVPSAPATTNPKAQSIHEPSVKVRLFMPSFVKQCSVAKTRTHRAHLLTA